MAQAARQLDLQVTHVIRFDFAWNQALAANTQASAAALLAAGIQIGTLPAGAIPVNVNAYVDVAFNNGTTNTFSVGLTATGTDFVSAGALGTKAAVITAAPIAAVATVKAVTSNQGTAIFLSAAQSGTTPTAGQCSVIVTYHPPLG